MSLVARYLSAVALVLSVSDSALPAPGDPARIRILQLVAAPATSTTKSVGPLGSGRVRLRVTPNTATDVPQTFYFKVEVDVRDVRDRGTPMASGFLTLSIPVQVVDQRCSGGSCPDVVWLPVSVACGSTGGWTPGQCRTRTLFDAVVPGVVGGDPGATVEIGQIRLLDGPDVVFVQAP
jgi:hypothetical protein